MKDLKVVVGESVWAPAPPLRGFSQHGTAGISWLWVKTRILWARPTGDTPARRPTRRIPRPFDLPECVPKRRTTSAWNDEFTDSCHHQVRHKAKLLTCFVSSIVICGLYRTLQWVMGTVTRPSGWYGGLNFKGTLCKMPMSDIVESGRQSESGERGILDGHGHMFAPNIPQPI